MQMGMAILNTQFLVVILHYARRT